MRAQGHQTVTRARSGKDGNPGVSSFKSVVFKRSNADSVAAPTGGSYLTPVPAGWSDGVPNGEEKLWMSTRIFTDTGAEPQQSVWTEPSFVTDTADIDFEFSAAATPGTPTTSSSKWHNTATPDDIWMAVRKKSNGVWGDWEVSKIKGEQGDPGKDGKTLYTWIKYADTSTGGGISDSPVNTDGTLKKYIGFAYNKETPTESSVASDYTWALFKGTDGTDGIPGEPGEDGTTYYTWIKYADSLGSSGYPTSMYDTAKSTTEYIGIAVNQTTQTEGTDPSVYSWSKFKGEQGDPGKDGKTLYTWIKYADTSTGGGISDSPVNTDGTLKKYIGFAYNKETPTESSVASDYTWALFKGTDGTDGLPGQPGADGKTYYTWIKYADSIGTSGYPTSMYDTPKTTTEYIGIAVNQTTQTEGTDPSKYSWSKFKGDQGAPGEDGKDGSDGKGIVSQVGYYAASASKTEVPTEWTPNTPPSMSATLRYLWKYTLTTFTDGTTEQTTPCVVGVFGADGLSYRYSKWAEGVEYRNDNNPYYRGSNGQGFIDVVYTEAITIYDPNTAATPPAGYICRKTHQSGPEQLWMTKHLFPSEETWTTPVAVKDTTTTEYRFSSSSAPGNPTDNTTDWHINADSTDKWMAIREKSGTTWGDWTVMRITGEKVSYASVTPSGTGNWTQSGKTFTSDTITGGTSTWEKITFTTTEGNAIVGVKITASSEANYDWGYICGLDKAYSTSDYLAKVSGTDAQTVEITVPTAGEHYFYVGYTKDFSGDKNNDNVVVEILTGNVESFTSVVFKRSNADSVAAPTGGSYLTPVPAGWSDGVPTTPSHPLTVGEEWTQMNSMAPILSALVIADRIKANFIDVENLAANSAFIDNLTVNRLVAGIQNGQRVEITPDNKSINIYDSDGTLASVFEGNDYANISSLFGDTSGVFSILSRTQDGYYGYSTGVSMSKGSMVGGDNGTVRKVIPLTSAIHFDKGAEVTIGAGNAYLKAEKPSGHGLIDLFGQAEIRIGTYNDQGCTSLISSSTIMYGTAYPTEYDTEYETNLNLDGKKAVIASGYSRVEIVLTTRKTGQAGYGGITFSWYDIANLSYTSDFYVSRYFANGLCLGIRNNNYVSIYNEANGMRMMMENEGYGLDFSHYGIKFKRSASEGWKSLIPTYGLPLAALAVGTMNLNSTSPSMGMYRTVEGGNTGMSVSRQSDGTFKVTVPSSWGSTYLVQLTTLGRANSGNVVACSVYTISTGSFIVDTKTTGDTWVNEVKVMFMITRLEDFNV